MHAYLPLETTRLPVRYGTDNRLPPNAAVVTAVLFDEFNDALRSSTIRNGDNEENVPTLYFILSYPPNSSSVFLRVASCRHAAHGACSIAARVGRLGGLIMSFTSRNVYRFFFFFFESVKVRGEPGFVRSYCRYITHFVFTEKTDTCVM